MSTEAAAAGPINTQSPGCKRPKAVGPEPSISEKVGTTYIPPKRQYLTRSKAVAIPCMGLHPTTPVVVFQSLHSSDDSAPSSTL